MGSAFRRSSFLIVPTVVGYLVFGLSLVAAVYQGGRFGAPDAMLVYGVLAAYSLGMLSSAGSRLLQNGFFVFGDTRTPATFGFLRVGVAVVVGAGLMLWLDRIPVVAGAGEGAVLYFGAVGLAIGSAVASWAEVLLLARRLRSRYGVAALPWSAASKSLLRASLAALPVVPLWWWLQRGVHPIVVAGLTVATFGGLYVGLSHRLGCRRRAPSCAALCAAETPWARGP